MEEQLEFLMEIASVAFGPKDSVRYLKIQFMENGQEPGKVIGRSKIVLEESPANLARDIYGGITGDQVGGGHGHQYWFYEAKDPEVQKLIKKEGDRKTQISHEAFAGYFEYIVMNISAGIDPAKKVLPQTIKALEKMMEVV